MTSKISGDDEAQVRAAVQRKYPQEPSGIRISPVRSSSEGDVDGQPAVIYYRLERRDHHHSGALYDCLVWQCSRSEGSDKLGVIAVKYVVGIHTLGGRTSSRYSLIFVDAFETGGNLHPQGSASTLRTMTIIDPPDDLLTDFLCPEEPEHILVARAVSGANLHVLVTTTYGHSLWETLVQPLLEHFALARDTDYIVHNMITEDRMIDLVSSTLLPRAIQGTQQTIVLLGGDEAVTCILNALLSTAVYSEGHAQSTSTARPYDQAGFVKPTLALFSGGTNDLLAYNNYIFGNRITKHSTHGLRTFLLGAPKPLPYFRASFSPGARLSRSPGRARAHSSTQPPDQPPKTEAHKGHEAISTLHGAIDASWALHAHDMARIHESRGLSLSHVANSRVEEGFLDGCKGKLTLLDASRLLPYGSGTLFCETMERRELVRREHTCVIATFCAFLAEGLEISPGNRIDEGLRVVESGPRLPCSPRIDDTGRNEAHATDCHATPSFDNGTKELIEAAYDEGRHVRNLQVGYHKIRGIRIETEYVEDGRGQQFCVDGRLLEVDKSGWMELLEIDHYREGVLDLISDEWEGSELSVGEEQRLLVTGTLDYPVNTSRFKDRKKPVDELR